MRLYAWYAIVGNLMGLSLLIVRALLPNPMAFEMVLGKALNYAAGAILGFGFLRMKRWAPLLMLGGMGAYWTAYLALSDSFSFAASEYSPLRLMAEGVKFLIPLGISTYYWRRFA
ncbi:MAG: hypothetical protein U0900_24235 [Myxococcota bacterium]